MIPRRPLDHYCDSREEKETIRRELFEGRSGFWQTGERCGAMSCMAGVRDRVPEVYREHLRQCC